MSLHPHWIEIRKIVAYNLQKSARQQAKAVLATTTHTGLFEDSDPSVQAKIIVKH
ncbi:MAG: hypothetical protein RMK50_06630 [Nitrososphaerota archaeon]|nr:hypothetical protein [Candidatus Bathyarchaeota archaeon]MDW8194477.1 hypothetical protein [Nitrososphaerota archaeon]